MADSTHVTIAVIAGLLGVLLFLFVKFGGGSRSESEGSATAAQEASNKGTAVSVPASSATTSTSINKKKKKKKKKAAVAPTPMPDPVQEEAEPPAVDSSAAANGGKKKKSKKKKSAAAKSAVEEVPAPALVAETPAPEPEPAPVVEQPAKSGKKKKKNKKGKLQAAVVTPAPTSSTESAANNKVTPSPPPPAVQQYDDDVGGWNTIAKSGKKSKAPAAPIAVTSKTEGENQVATLTLNAEDIPVLIGPKGATIQRLTADTGARLDIDKTPLGGTSTLKISGTDAAVQKATEEVQSLINQEASKRQAAAAHTVTLSGSTIKGSDGVKAIIGKGGSTIQKIQASTGCQLKASVDAASVTIAGPTAASVATATQLCKNAVFGETQSSIDLETQAMVMAVCGKSFTVLRQMQDQTGTRLDFTTDATTGARTLLNISGDTANVARAKDMVAARMQLVQGVSLEFETSKTGAIYGKGGTNLRRIQDTTGASIDVIDITSTVGIGLCKIHGDPAAVKAAQAMVLKSLSGEVELKPGQVREVVVVGVGAAAVVGRGGSKITELETTHNVKLNLQSGSGECSIVGKQADVTSAKEAIEAIVEPLKAKALEEAKIQAKAEELAATSGDGTWGVAAGGAGSWDDAIEETGW